MLNHVIVLAGIAVIIAGLLLNRQNKKNPESKGKPHVVGVVIGIILIVIANSFTIIPTGYTGVVTTFGQIRQETVPNGFNFHLPFIQTISQVCNKQQDLNFSGQIWSETKNRTAIYYDSVNITYQISGTRSAWICANVADYENNLITQSLIASAVKSSSKELADEDATNRSKIEPLAMQKLQESLDSKYGENTIIINKVVIGNADFDESYNNAIAEKQNAQLAYEKQQIENQKLIEQAEAEAKAKKIAAQGEAEANEILTSSLSKDIFTQMMLEKWNGQLPKVVGEGNAVFDISSMLGEESTSNEEQNQENE